MFNDKDLEILDFAVRFVIANIDNELLDIMQESLKMPREVSEAELERIRHDLANRRAELKVVEDVLDKAKVASNVTRQSWDRELGDLADKAKYDAVHELNYELAAHWRDVRRAFLVSLHTMNQWFTVLTTLQKQLPADTSLAALVREALSTTVIATKIEKGDTP